MHATTRELMAMNDGEPVDTAVSRHVSDCEECRSAMAALSEQQAALRALPALAAPDAAWEAIRAGMKRPAPDSGSRRPPILPLALAASLAGLLMVTVLEHTPPGDRAGNGLHHSLAAEALQAEAMELRDVRRLMGSGQVPLSLDAASTIDALDQRLDRLDTRLADSREPKERHRLWQEKVHLLEAALILEASENDSLLFADAAIL
ncbi:hypothetical protein [Natronospira bacteriovora]|uniref:Zinc-finger domain-containing protein n=1 Tax=Natronospira bacteriovora TaxID=3069753 RepID=A0ABU0WAV9_9GAMM|nr:hypothetical protein [Natronospira sp. AB-CW4]MDQ2070080.1 hypothetical protein [Natronospira sp. AB-CW4]